MKTAEEISVILEKTPMKDAVHLVAASEMAYTVHTDTSQIKTPAHNKFIKDNARIFSPWKEKAFTIFFENALPTASSSLLQHVFSDFEKIFEGENAHRRVETIPQNSAIENDAETKIIPKVKHFMQHSFMPAYQNTISSLVVIDAPVEGGEPYAYIVNPTDLVHAEEDEFGVTCVLFKDEEGYIFADDQYFRKFNKYKVQVSESLHGLSYCPAIFVSNMKQGYGAFPRKNLISPHVGKLNGYLFDSVSAKHLGSYASYPIVAVRGAANIASIYNEDEAGTISPEESARMKADLAGAGSVVISNEDGVPASFINPDVAIMENARENVSQQASEVIRAIFGMNSEMWAEAVNEKQVEFGVEGKQATIMKLKRNFEHAEYFILRTILEMKYKGSEMIVTVNYGNKFFLRTSAELADEMALVLNSGASESVKNAIENELVQARFGHNPSEVLRIKMKKALEPFRGLDISQIVQIVQAVPSLVIDLVIKSNFEQLIAMIEAESGRRIEDFDTNSPNGYFERLNELKQKLKDYAGEFAPAAG